MIRSMARYSDEIVGLRSAYQLARSAPVEHLLLTAREVLRSRSLIAIGSGGTVAVAELAASAHVGFSGRSARACTPLEFVEQAKGSIEAPVVMVFSARAKHPDTAFAIAHAEARGLDVVLVTQRDPDELDLAIRDNVRAVLTVPSEGKDGFLATRSVLSMATMVLRLYGESDLLPELLPSLDSGLAGPVVRGRILVLAGAAGRPAAVDIETRMNELGLADVQIADYRNVAHGRHVGLSRRLESTTIIALLDPQVSELAEKTLATVPADADIRRVHTKLQNDVGSLDLLAAVMELPVLLAGAQGVEPSRPRVPAFGRALYHLPFKRMYPVSPIGPIEKKMLAGGFDLNDDIVRQLHVAAFREWRAAVRRAPIDSLLLDYDGTCVSTAGRFDLPRASVQNAIRGVLAEGIHIVFASGRGSSLYDALRSWVPRALWPMVTLGLHNGSWLQELDNRLVEPDREDGPLWIEPLIEALRPYADAGAISTRRSGAQLSVSSERHEVGHLRGIVESTVYRMGIAEDVLVRSSGHSVDAVDSSSGKASVLRHASSRFGSVLAVGDQGAPGGNDFDLLAATAMSLSVDKCSADLTRCWNLSSGATSGPDALVEAIGLIRRTAGSHSLGVKALSR